MFHSIFFARDDKSDEAVLESLQSKQEVKLTSKEKLNRLWITDPLTKQGIDLILDLLNKGFKLETKDTNVETDLKIIDKNTDISDFNNKMARDAIIFGNAFGEYLYNRNKTKILGLWNMDPVKTDFQKDMNEKIIMDDTGKPKGFIQDIGVMGDTGKKEIVTTPSGQRGLGFTTKNVFFFNFERFSGTIEGISNLQTVAKLIEAKQEAELGVTQAIKRFGIPIITVEAGDDRHMISPENLKRVREKLEGIDKKNVIVTPYYQKLGILQPKQQISKLSENLQYYVQQISLGLGIPYALITGTGETANRATLRQLIRLFIARLEKKREKEREFWVREILPFISEINKWKSIPKPTWQPITLEDVESLAKRLAEYVKNQILTAEEAKKIVSQSEGFNGD